MNEQREKNNTKKKIITIIAIIIIIIILLLLRSCNKKHQDSINIGDKDGTSVQQEVIKDNKSEKETDSKETKQEETKKDDTIVSDDYLYYVNFLNIDGTVLQRTVYKKGELPSYRGAVPTYSDNVYYYTFLGWDKTISVVNSTQTYTAKYNKTIKETEDTTHVCSHYAIQSDGSWKCSDCGRLLANTDDAYFTVLSNDQPTEIVKLTEANVSPSRGIKKENNNISYTNTSAAQDVVIRTNSAKTALTIDDKSESKIAHYGSVGALNIIECHTASYHEHGKVAFAEIAKGRIALEKDSEVGKLHFDATTQKDFEQIIVAADPSVTLPEFSRDEANIKDTGTLVIELQKDTNNNNETEKDYVWLYKQGVISQIVVVDEKIDGIEKKDDKFVATNDNNKVVALGVSEQSTATQKAAVEIANNYTGNNTNGSITIGETDIELPKLDKNGDIEVVEGVATADIAEKLGEDKTIEDVIKSSKENIANAVILVDDSKKSEDLKGKTADQIEEVVKEVAVEESGLDNAKKEEEKNTVVEKHYIEELKEKAKEQGVCDEHTWDDSTIIKVEPTCFEDGYVLKTCSICGYKEMETLKAYGHNKNNPNIIGIYCNHCHHPVAFVDEIADFTPAQENENPELMPIIDITKGLNMAKIVELYLDVAYSFKTFPNMENQTLDNTKWYKMDLTSFTLVECEEQFENEDGFVTTQEGMYFTAKGIYNFFSDWKCDYYVSFDKDIEAISCGLGGYYESWSLGVGFWAPTYIPANYEVPLLGYMMNNGTSNWSYKDIANIVGEFKCGFFNLSDDNIGTTFTVKLRMLNPFATEGYERLEMVDMGNGVSLPNYIDVAVTNYEIKAISEENAAILEEYQEVIQQYLSQQ